MKSSGRFARSEKPRHSRLRRFRVHADAPHHVVACRAHLHGALGDVDIRKFLELVIHARKLFLHVLGRLVGNIQIGPAVFGTAAFLDLGVNGSCNDVARGKFHALGVVLFHEAFARLVAQDAAFSANCFRDENALHAGRPDHSRGMELNEFHIHQLRPRFISKGHPVAGVFPRIGSDAPRLPNSAGGDNNRLRFENDEAAVLAPIRKSAGDTAVIRQEPGARAFHVNVDALLDAAILQRANHFEAGAVAHMAEALEGVPAKSSLKDVATFGAVEERAPLFEFTNSGARSSTAPKVATSFSELLAGTPSSASAMWATAPASK